MRDALAKYAAAIVKLRRHIPLARPNRMSFFAETWYPLPKGLLDDDQADLEQS